ncbi:hypothetical protein ACWKWU_00475 [Chitinophaga lutea]
MKRTFTYILLLVYTVSCTELRELVKLPVLIQHFQEHKALNGGITFAAFLIDHYNNEPHTDNDEERDNQLPFKRVDSGMHASPVIPVTNPITLRKPVQPVASNEKFPRNDNRIPSAGISKIWQPPRA